MRTFWAMIMFAKMSMAVALITFAFAPAAKADDAKTLGARAASAERAFYVFGTNRDAHAAKFMKAWVDACDLAEGDMMSESRKSFITAYIEGLQREPDAAVKKPLQNYVRQNFWKSGSGCDTIKEETPQWALK